MQIKFQELALRLAQLIWHWSLFTATIIWYCVWHKKKVLFTEDMTEKTPLVPCNLPGQYAQQTSITQTLHSYCTDSVAMKCIALSDLLSPRLTKSTIKSQITLHLHTNNWNVKHWENLYYVTYKTSQTMGEI